MGLTFCAVVVVRYFGGTLLGKPGLIHAYGTAARLALSAASVIERVVMERSVITCSYDRFEMLKNDVRKAGGTIVDSAFGDGCQVLIELPRGTTTVLHRKWGSLGMTSEPQ
jgi:putative IMPACT (imprinted ancient) family translation regulator